MGEELRSGINRSSTLEVGCNSMEENLNLFEVDDVE